MRITKKYTGASCLGKRVYHYDSSNVNAEEAEKARVELEELEKGFREKLEQMNRKRFCDVGSAIENSKMISTPAIDALLQSNKVMQANNSASAGNHLRMVNPMPTMMKNMYPGMMPNHAAMYPPHPAYMPYPGAMYSNPNDPSQQYIRPPSSDNYYTNYQYYIPPPPSMMHLFHNATSGVGTIYPFPSSIMPTPLSDATNAMTSNHPSDDDLPDVFDDAEVIEQELAAAAIAAIATTNVSVEPVVLGSIDLVVPKVEVVQIKSPKAVQSIVAPVSPVAMKAEVSTETPVKQQKQQPIQEEMVVPEPPKVLLSNNKKHLLSASATEESNYNNDAYTMMPPMKKPRASSYGSLSAYIPTVSSSSMLSADQNIDTHSLIGIFTHLHKISSKEDLADFIFENNASSSAIPMVKASPLAMLHKTASNKMLSKVDSVESLCKLISPQFYTSNI